MNNEQDNSQPPKILVIEDEPEIRRFLRTTLANSGYRMLESQNGADGLEQAAGESPAAVLLDLGLPDMDGLSVIGKLRAGRKCRSS